jgi:hypothetical protein
MTYYQNISSIAEKIQSAAKEIISLEKGRERWKRPETEYISLGGSNTYVTSKDGTTPPHLEGIKRETLKAFDQAIFAKQGELEGLRFKLVNLAKKGGAA